MLNQARRALISAALVGLTATQLVGCGSPASSVTAAAQPTAAQQPDAAAQPTAAALDPLAGALTATGEIKVVQDANLAFQVAGTVAQVLVKEGDTVKKDQLLAILDVRSFDEKVSQAQAALQIAQAQLLSAEAQKQTALASQAGLTDPPKPALVQAARAQVQAAAVALKQARTGQRQNVISAQAGLTAAQDSLQSTKDKLSRVKTQADATVDQLALALTQAQASYALAKNNWEYAQSTGKNPQQPTTINGKGKVVDNKLTDAQLQQYYATYVQAEAALHQAEQKLSEAQVDAGQARQAEIVGIQAAEQQVTQSQSALDKVAVPADQDSVAAAQASLAAAQANLANLQPDPRPSEKAKADAAVAAADAAIAAAQANVAQAQAALQQAQLSRSYAELHAPYDGTVAQVNVDPFDSSTTVGQPAIRMLDLSVLRVEVPISDVDIMRVQLGQAATIHVDTDADVSYTGKVSYIAPEATSNGVTRTYLVRIALDKQDGLRPGMQVRVDIATQ